MKTALQELIEKWENEKNRYRKVCDEPLMWEAKERFKAAAFVQVLCAVLADMKKLEPLE